MTTPQISIITPVFNTGALLMETVESVLNQQPYQETSVPEFEMIIVDDHSQDPETLAILEKLPGLDARIKVIKNQRKKGVSGARNTGIDQARGGWLAFLDSDDLLLPQSLACRWNYVTHTSGVDWLATPFYLLKPESGLEKKTFSEKSPFLYNLIRDEFDQGKASILRKPVNILCGRSILGVATILVRREKVLQLNGFNEELKRHEDFELWCRLAAQNDLHHLIEDTSIYRIRPGSLTHSFKEPTFFGEEVMLKGLMADPLLGPYLNHLRQRLQYVLLDYCYYYRLHGSYFEAVKWALEFIKEFPLSFKAWKMLLVSLLGK